MCAVRWGTLALPPAAALTASAARTRRTTSAWEGGLGAGAGGLFLRARSPGFSAGRLQRDEFALFDAAQDHDLGLRPLPKFDPARIETVPVPNVDDGIAAYFKYPLKRHIQSIFDLVDDDFGVGQQSRPQQDVDIGTLGRRLRQLGAQALFLRELPGTASIAATGTAKTSSATARTARTRTAGTTEVSWSTATTRSAGATTFSGLTHLLENPLPLLLAQGLNISAPEKLLHSLAGTAPICVGELSAALSANSGAGPAWLTRACSLPLAASFTLASPAESTFAGASRTARPVATTAATHLLKDLLPLFLAQGLDVPASQKLLHALAHLLAVLPASWTTMPASAALSTDASLPAGFAALWFSTRAATLASSTEPSALTWVSRAPSAAAKTTLS